jgi:hypothetical protein
MKRNRFMVFWRDRLVGFIGEPKVEMFEIYGEWEPISSEDTNRFLAAVAESEEETVFVGSSETDRDEAEIFSVPTTRVSVRLKVR